MSNHLPATNRLRKRQIVVLGHGISVLAFCSRFQSDWAEVTVVSTISEYAPQTALHGIAAGHLEVKDFTSLLHVRLAKRKNLRFISDEVTHLDLQTREISLSKTTEPLHFDYLLVGGVAAEKQAPDALPKGINTITDAVQFANMLKGNHPLPEIRIQGADGSSIDLAATLTRPSATGNMTHQSKISLICEDGFNFANRSISKKTEEKFANQLRWESILLLEAEIASKTKEKTPTIRVSAPHFPKWFAVLSEEKTDSGKVTLKSVRPDLSLRAFDRVYLLPELVHIQDSLGKDVPVSDHAWMQQGDYLAKIIRGKIEAKRGYQGDCPGFVLKDTVSLTTVRNWKSIGYVGHVILPQVTAFLVDLLFRQYPVFRRAYGGTSGAYKMLCWLRRCK